MNKPFLVEVHQLFLCGEHKKNANLTIYADERTVSLFNEEEKSNEDDICKLDSSSEGGDGEDSKQFKKSKIGKKSQKINNIKCERIKFEKINVYGLQCGIC